MDFISNQEEQLRVMLAEIGVSSVDDLLSAVPAHLKMATPSCDDGLSEYEGLKLMQDLAEKNRFPSMDNYLGAGAYEHHIPALVGAVCSKSEFLTSYTPYQAEASQGMLQIIFEFQSAICALTGMDVANASVYDGASACAEALLMALRSQKKRRKLVMASTVHPHYRAVVESYVANHVDAIELLPYRSDGQIDEASLDKILNHQVAAVLIQSPNFFGVIEESALVASRAKSVAALSVLAANPLSYGIYASAGELGFDIAVGDCQPFGLPLAYGGPYVGYMACRENLLRQLPGRIVGETVDSENKRGFVLTLQAREQHIRREKATSNICTNQALAALASLVSILWYGKEGVGKLALTNYRRTAYLKNKLEAVAGIKIWPTERFFNEFVVDFGVPAKMVETHFYKHGIAPGVPLQRFYSELKDHWLVAVTETKNQSQLDHYVEVARTLKEQAH